jgi:hypothetical protein
MDLSTGRPPAALISIRDLDELGFVKSDKYLRPVNADWVQNIRGDIQRFSFDNSTPRIVVDLETSLLPPDVKVPSMFDFTRPCLASEIVLNTLPHGNLSSIPRLVFSPTLLSCACVIDGRHRVRALKLLPLLYSPDCLLAVSCLYNTPKHEARRLSLMASRHRAAVPTSLVDIMKCFPDELFGSWTEAEIFSWVQTDTTIQYTCCLPNEFLSRTENRLRLVRLTRSLHRDTISLVESHLSAMVLQPDIVMHRYTTKLVSALTSTKANPNRLVLPQGRLSIFEKNIASRCSDKEKRDLQLIFMGCAIALCSANSEPSLAAANAYGLDSARAVSEVIEEFQGDTTLDVHNTGAVWHFFIRRLAQRRNILPKVLFDAFLSLKIPELEVGLLKGIDFARVQVSRDSEGGNASARFTFDDQVPVLAEAVLHSTDLNTTSIHSSPVDKRGGIKNKAQVDTGIFVEGGDSEMCVDRTEVEYRLGQGADALVLLAHPSPDGPVRMSPSAHAPDDCANASSSSTQSRTPDVTQASPSSCADAVPASHHSEKAPIPMDEITPVISSPTRCHTPSSSLGRSLRSAISSSGSRGLISTQVGRVTKKSKLPARRPTKKMNFPETPADVSKAYNRLPPAHPVRCAYNSIQLANTYLDRFHVLILSDDAPDKTSQVIQGPHIKEASIPDDSRSGLSLVFIECFYGETKHFDSTGVLEELLQNGVNIGIVVLLMDISASAVHEATLVLEALSKLPHAVLTFQAEFLLLRNNVDAPFNAPTTIMMARSFSIRIDTTQESTDGIISFPEASDASIPLQGVRVPAGTSNEKARMQFVTELVSVFVSSVRSKTAQKVYQLAPSHLRPKFVFDITAFETIIARAVLFSSSVGYVKAMKYKLRDDRCTTFPIYEMLRQQVTQTCVCHGKHEFLSASRMRSAADSTNVEPGGFYMKTHPHMDEFGAIKPLNHASLLLRHVRPDGEAPSRGSADRDLCGHREDLDGRRLSEGAFISNSVADNIKTCPKPVLVVRPAGALMDECTALKQYGYATSPFSLPSLYVSGISCVPLWFFFTEGSIASLINSPIDAGAHNVSFHAVYDTLETTMAMADGGFESLRKPGCIIVPILHPERLLKETIRCTECGAVELLASYGNLYTF